LLCQAVRRAHLIIVEEPFHLGAQLIGLTGLPPGQVEEIVAVGWLAIHDEGFTRAGPLDATGEHP
jgi:hypothetical protein